MSTKEMIYHLIDGFSEAQLKGILTMLEGLQSVVDEAEDDAYCNRLYDNYKATADDNEELTELSDFAKELGIEL